MIGQTISHYKILEKLGEGGMGIIYKAEDLKLGRNVALKFLPLELTQDKEAKARFINEAHSASSLQHHNVYTIHDIDETDDGQMFICMDYYEGETLKDKISNGPLIITEVIDIVMQISEGLKKAHENGIVHRDIKPSNIFITKDGIVKILDFGIAKLLKHSFKTITGKIIGTVEYMSPEQITGENIDYKTDIWSIGVLLYEMLSGDLPFKGEYDQVIIYSILNNEPDEINLNENEDSEKLIAIVKKCLQKEPENRYQSINELETDFNEFQNDAGSLEFITKRKKQLFNKTKLITSTVFILTILLTLIIWLTRSKSIIPLNKSEYVLVTDFKNKTTERNFDNSLSLAMKVSLRQSPFINIFPGDRIYDVLKRMEKPLNTSLNDTIALEIARRERVRIIIAGEIYQLGKKYILSSKIIDAVKGEPVKIIRKEAFVIENVLNKMDELSLDVRSNLGESLQQIGKYKIPLEKATTKSIDALELYAQGDIAESMGDYKKSLDLKERAFALDTLFTLAVSDLSYIYKKLGNDSLAFYYHRKVIPLLSGVTERERLYILSIYYGPSFEFDIPRSLQSIRQYLSLYPNDALGYSLLGWISMFTGDIKTALEASKNSIAIDSIYRGTVYNNLGYSLAQNGFTNEALQYFLKSKKLRPSYTAIDIYIAQLSWLQGKYDSAESSLMLLLLNDNPKSKFVAYTQLISLLYFQGRLNEAKTFCNDAIVYCRKEKLKSKYAYLHYLNAEIAADQDNFILYRKEMTSAENLSRSPFLELPLIGVSYAGHGMIVKAKSILKKLSTVKSKDPYFIKRKKHFECLIKGEILHFKKQYKESINEFSAVEKIQKADPYFFIAQKGIAKCYIGLKDTNVVNILNPLIENKSESIMGHLQASFYTGFWTRYLWPEVHLELGKQLISQHKIEKAKYHLERCIKCWKNSDKEFKKAKEASELLAQLSRR